MSPPPRLQRRKLLRIFPGTSSDVSDPLEKEIRIHKYEISEKYPDEAFTFERMTA